MTKQEILDDIYSSVNHNFAQYGEDRTYVALIRLLYMGDSSAFTTINDTQEKMGKYYRKSA